MKTWGPFCNAEVQGEVSEELILFLYLCRMKTWGHFGNAEVQGEASEELVGTGDELFLFLDKKPTKPGHIVAWNFYTFTVRGWVVGG